MHAQKPKQTYQKAKETFGFKKRSSLVEKDDIASLDQYIINRFRIVRCIAKQVFQYFVD